MNLGLAYYLMDRFEQAIKVLTRGIVQHPDFAGNYIVAAAAYARSSQPKEAGKAVEEALRLHPFFSLDDYGSAFQRETDRESIKEGLRLAGFH